MVTSMSPRHSKLDILTLNLSSFKSKWVPVNPNESLEWAHPKAKF